MNRNFFNAHLPVVELFVLGLSGSTLLFWLTGEGLFYSEASPTLSPLTSASLFLMMLPRIAKRYSDHWSAPMTLAVLGIVASGNISNLFIHLMNPELFLIAAPALVPTSALTSVGLILLCFYDILVELRKTPQSAFILDDILLHLALFPGALSLLGLLLGVSIYRGTGVDPRVGVSILEMILMGSYVYIAALSNPNLFLWRFLSKDSRNRLVFTVLFINQYGIAFALAPLLRNPDLSSTEFGIEFYILLAGVLTTLFFLTINAFFKGRLPVAQHNLKDDF